MVHTAFTNDAIDAAVEALHDAIEDLQRWPVQEKAIDLSGLIAANQQLRELLPQEAAQADEFVNDEFADSRDYEQVFENLSLVAMYVMMGVPQLVDSKSFSSFNHLLTRLVDDVSDLTSWTSNFDINYGVFVHPGDKD